MGRGRHKSEIHALVHHRSEACFHSAFRSQMAIRNTRLGALPVATDFGGSKFGERQRDDLRRQRQPDISRVHDKPLPGLVAEVLLE